MVIRRWNRNRNRRADDAMSKLFPDIKPNKTFFLETDAPHSLYVEESGNEKGIPVVFLHGGPGAGCEPGQREDAIGRLGGCGAHRARS